MEGFSQTHLVFRLNRALFALEAKAVREVLPLPAIAAVEETPPYVVGAINLRGRIVPVLDLNLRFGHPTVPGRAGDALVIVEIDELQAGIMVSEALEVADIPPQLIEPPPLPESPERIFPPFVTGNARIGEELIMVLDHRLLILWVDQGGWLPEQLPGQPDEADLANARSIDMEQTDRDWAILRQRAIELQSPLQDDSDDAVVQLAAIQLGGEFLGLLLSQVLQFTAIQSLTPLPNCPNHIVGIMNLRGEILTALDLRDILGLLSRPFTASSKVVIAEAAGLRAGIVVDDILDILSYRTADLASLPTVGKLTMNDSALGILPYLGKSLMVLDLDILFANQMLTSQTATTKGMEDVNLAVLTP